MIEQGIYIDKLPFLSLCALFQSFLRGTQVSRYFKLLP
jgi:hypothetical protein